VIQVGPARFGSY